MRNRFVLLAVLAVGSLAPTALAATPAVRSVSATLTPQAVQPPSASKGSGRIVIKLDAAAGKACWTLTTSGLDRTIGAHVHRGVKGKTGAVVLPLGDRFAKGGCVAAPKSAIAAVAAKPSSYYVDVHTYKNVNGAIRGQLHRGS
jgi:hypothetical protein